MAPDAERLRDIVNASGFVFQLGLEQRIRDTAASHEWTVMSHEHPWAIEDQQGFIDLVIGKGNLRIAIECKRPRDGDWVFLVPEAQSETSRFRTQWAHGAPKQPALVGWDDFSLTPKSLESAFCHIRGTGEDQRSLLERTATVLTDSLGSLAAEELGTTSWTGFSQWFVYLPMIVTTATLHVCRFDPASVDLTRGELANADFEQPEFIRFRKSLAHHLPPFASIVDIGAIAAGKERSVLVTTADGLFKMLPQIEMKVFDRFQGLPWEAARRAAH